MWALIYSMINVHGLRFIKTNLDKLALLVGKLTIESTFVLYQGGHQPLTYAFDCYQRNSKRGDSKSRGKKSKSTIKLMEHTLTLKSLLDKA